MHVQIEELFLQKNYSQKNKINDVVKLIHFLLTLKSKTIILSHCGIPKM